MIATVATLLDSQVLLLRQRDRQMFVFPFLVIYLTFFVLGVSAGGKSSGEAIYDLGAFALRRMGSAMCDVIN